MGAYEETTPTWIDGINPSTGLPYTPIDAADLQAYNNLGLATNADLVVLYYNGTTYVPKNGDTTAISDSSKGRTFIGVVDPATVPGVALVDNDVWFPYT